jgi:hypothetical protein
MGDVILFPGRRVDAAGANGTGDGNETRDAGQPDAGAGQAVTADLTHAVDYLIEHYPGNEALMASMLLHQAAKLAHEMGTDVGQWFRRVADDIEEE